MILGLGTDIVEIIRVKTALERTPKFAARILASEELSEYEQQRFPERYLAKRFAVKEAVAKALGTGIGRGVGWHHIRVERSESGQSLCAGGDWVFADLRGDPAG